MIYKIFLNPLKIAGANPSYDNAIIIFFKKTKEFEKLFFLKKYINLYMYIIN